MTLTVFINVQICNNMGNWGCRKIVQNGRNEVLCEFSHNTGVRWRTRVRRVGELHS